MSIFKRRRDRAEDSAPAAQDSAEPGPTLEPQPYFAPGMPSLHAESAPRSAPPGESDQAPPQPAWSPTAQPARASAGSPGFAPVHAEQEAAASHPPVAVEDEGVDDVRVDPASDDSPEQPVPQVAPVSRSGRNMPIAAAVGLALLALTVAAAWWDARAFAGLICLASIAAVLEWRRVLSRHARRVPLIPVVLATVGMLVATWFAGPEGLTVAVMVGCAGTVAWRTVDERIENTMADSLASMMTLLWIPFLASFLLLMELADDGWQRVVVVVLAVVGSDTGGLFSGMLLGRHPMAPRVSPKKTWEGFAGGMLLGVGAASVAAYFFFDGDWWIGAIVGVAAVIAGVLGDLAESAVKRDIQVKDMSSVLPGHGGIMDRIDSLLLAAPAAYVVFALLMGAV